MKKTAIIVGAILASLSLTPAQAADSKALAIIDSYFDSRVSVSKIVCIASDGCKNTIKNIPTSVSSAVNHGDAMVEVAQRQNPNVGIVALRSASSSTTTVNDVNAGDFINALTWINNNYTTIGAVSFSRFFNGTKVCSPSSINTANYGGVSGADKTIRSLILSLKSKGIPVFISTGNTMGKPVDYPACIVDTNAVGVGDLYNGSVVSVNAFDANTDYFVTGSIYSYTSKLFGLIANTTSAANVAVAAKYLSGTLVNKFTSVLN